MNPEFDERALLALFHDPDSDREAFRAPFLAGGYVCATDNHSLILIRPEACRGTYRPQNLDVLRFLKPGKDAPATMTLADLRQAIAKVPGRQETRIVSPAVLCPECGGQGQVEWTRQTGEARIYRHYFECPACRGTGNSREAIKKPTGRRIPAPFEIIGIRRQVFNARMLLVLCDAMELLGIDKAAYTAGADRCSAIFTLTDQVTIILAPCVPAEKPAVSLPEKP